MMSNNPVSDDDIAKIKDQMFESIGTDLSDFKTPFLLRRINTRMVSKGIREGSEYAKLLSEDPIEALTLYNSFSINVTEFFRDTKVWGTFALEVIPQVIKQSTSNEIKVWSAGCATGQEPYSLAIMLKESLANQKISFEITATDMNKVSIGIAKEGIYDEKSLKRIPTWLIPKYFEKLDNDLYKVRDDLKKSIKFVLGDVLTYPLASLDVVVCRNLLIYYSKTAQELLFKKFHNTLKNNGFVVLGMDETMIGTEGAKLFKAIFPRERIFQRIG